MDTLTLGLLQYDYTDKFNVVLYSSKSTHLQDALNYLIKVQVKFVQSIPEKAFGYYCVLEKAILYLEQDMKEKTLEYPILIIRNDDKEEFRKRFL